VVTVLKYGSKKETINRLLDRLKQHPSNKGIDAYKYCGVIDIVEDPIDIQANLRNEWE